MNTVLTQGVALSSAVFPGVRSGDDQALGGKDLHPPPRLFPSPARRVPGAHKAPGKAAVTGLGMITLNAQGKLGYDEVR